jgi:hypothetical protein
MWVALVADLDIGVDGRPVVSRNPCKPAKGLASAATVAAILEPL